VIEPGTSSLLRTTGRLAARRESLLALAVGLPVSGLLLYLSVRKLDVNTVVTALRAADATRLALAVAIIPLMYGVQALRWRWIARQEARVSTWRFVQYVIGAVALNNAVPGRPGDFLRAHWLGRAANASRVNTLGTVVVDRSADLLTLLAALAVVFPFVGPDVPWLRHLALVAVAIIAGSTIGLVIAYRLRRRLLNRVGSRFPRVLMETGKLLRAMRRSCDPIGIVGIVVASVVSWGLWGVAAWLVAGSVGVSISPIQIAFLMAIVNLGVAIPSSPGFVGTYQWLCVSALAVFGVSRPDAFAFSVLMHAVWFVPSSIAGIALIAGGSVRGSVRVMHPAADPSTS
jgi:glycosyltransferase 2 family protein